MNTPYKVSLKPDINYSKLFLINRYDGTSTSDIPEVYLPDPSITPSLKGIDLAIITVLRKFNELAGMEEHSLCTSISAKVDDTTKYNDGRNGIEFCETICNFLIDCGFTTASYEMPSSITGTIEHTIRITNNPTYISSLANVLALSSLLDYSIGTGAGKQNERLFTDYVFPEEDVLIPVSFKTDWDISKLSYDIFMGKYTENNKSFLYNFSSQVESGISDIKNLKITLTVDDKNPLVEHALNYLIKSFKMGNYNETHWIKLSDTTYNFYLV